MIQGKEIGTEIALYINHELLNNTIWCRNFSLAIFP